MKNINQRNYRPVIDNMFSDELNTQFRRAKHVLLILSRRPFITIRQRRKGVTRETL